MAEIATCGRGLAANAQLPEQLGELAAAMAAVLEAHLPMLDLTDQPSVKEHEVYVELIAEHRNAAVILARAAQRMAQARDLPMGRHRHDPAANAAMVRAFAVLVDGETALHAALATRIERDHQMLASMRRASESHEPRGA